MRVAIWVLAFALACGDDDGATDAGSDAGTDTGPDAGGPDAGDADAGPGFPPTLRGTGLYTAEGRLAPDVVEFGVRYPLWSDGLRKTRWVALREGGVIDTSDPDQWRFPVGTRLWKEFAREDGTRIETRLFEKRDLGWVGVSYVWREDSTDADALPEGTDDLGGSGYEIPSTARCLVCHRASSDRVLGVSRFLLDRDDFAAMQAQGWFAGDPLADPPGDATAQAALGTLHANCGTCHSDGAPPGMVRPLRMRLVSSDTDAASWLATAIDQEAFHDIDGTRTLLVAGDAEASQLYVRMGLRGDNGMPPFGTDLVDTEGHAAVGAFIDAL